MNIQNKILELFKNDKSKELKKSEIIVLGKFEYWRNTEKYVGEALSRMVKKGKLQRIIKGTYKLGFGNVREIVAKNQIDMFQ